MKQEETFHREPTISPNDECLYEAVLQAVECRPRAVLLDSDAHGLDLSVETTVHGGHHAFE